MNPGLVVKLRPSGPWRIGPDSGARNRVDVIYHSDSLFSAVTSAMSRMGRLDEWLDATARMPAPAVFLSSCFPFIEETGFVVPPRTVWPPASPSLMAAHIRWKSARFIPLGMVQSILAGERLDENRWSVDGPSGCLVPLGRQGPFRTSVRWSAAVDRLSGASERHSTACIEFRPGAGLWTVIGFADDAARDRWQDGVKAAFRLLADTGFGGERSRGWGRSEAPEFIEGELPGMIIGEAPKTAATAPLVETPETAAGPGEAPEPQVAEARVTAPPLIAPLEAAAAPVETPVASGEPAVEPEEIAENPAALPEGAAPGEIASVLPETAAAAESATAAPQEAAALPEGVAPEGIAPSPQETAASVEATPAAPQEAAALTEGVAPEEIAPALETAAAAESATAAPQEAAALPEGVAPGEIAPAPLDTTPAAESTPAAPQDAAALPEAAAPEESLAAPAEAAVLPEEAVAVPAAATEPQAEGQPIGEAAPIPETPAPVEPVSEPAPAPPVAASQPEPEAVPLAKPLAAPKGRGSGQAHWLLSLFAPAAADTVDWARGSYTVLARGGRVESPAGSGELKKQVQMVAEGSVIIAESAPRGAAPDVAPDGFAHPVFRAGFALAIPLPEGN